MTENKQHLDYCKILIEEKINWGTSASWQSEDFDKLSRLIFQDSNVLLSASTLKRIWGKVQYHSSPQQSTLNALAKFAIGTDWRGLILAYNQSKRTTDTSGTAKKTKIPSTLAYTLLIIAVVSSLTIAWFTFRRPALQFENVKFSSQPIADGVPNTVIFEYDAQNSNADSVFIQQNWDATRRVRVDKNKHTFASTYYIPGYYRAKLILNDIIAKEHDVFIESNGWLGLLIDQSTPTPTYLPQETIVHPDYVGIKDRFEPAMAIKDHSIPLMLTLVDKHWHIDSQNFQMRLTLQNTDATLGNACRKSQVLLLGTSGVMAIPLAKLGCVGELKLRLGDHLLDGTTHNLAGFGIDPSLPALLTVNVVAGNVLIEVNGKQAYKGMMAESIGNIVGIRVSFDGTGYLQNFNIEHIPSS